MNKIKVVHVITDSNIGGAGVCLCNLMRRADFSRFDYAVVMPEGAKLAAEMGRLGVRVVEAAGLAERSFDGLAALRLVRLFHAERPDVVHTHAALSARVAARLSGMGIKIVHTRHSVFDNADWKKTGFAKMASGGLNNTLSDAIIAVSPAAADNIVEIGAKRDKITVIYNGVEPLEPLTEQEKTAARRRFGVNSGEFVVSIIARLTEVKGHDYAIDAARILGGGVRLLIAGAGDYEAALKARALGLDNVSFLGFVDGTRDLLGITDVQLNASFGTEATSLALLEGLSLGIPAVATNFGGNPYVINDGINGFVVGTKNAASLAGGIKRVMADKPLRDRLRQGAVDSFSRFTAERMARETEELYSRLVKD